MERRVWIQYLQAKVSETCWAIRGGVGGYKEQEGTKGNTQISGPGLLGKWPGYISGRLNHHTPQYNLYN